MGKVVVSEFVSVDGFIQDPSWTAPYWGDQIGAFKEAEMREADALLLGRTTHEAFAASWPDHPEEGDYKVKMNSMPKHVATTTATELAWNGTPITGDLAEGVAKLKAEKNLLVFGSGALVAALREHGLVDEYRLVIYPVLLGSGLSMYAPVNAEATVELASSEVLDNGVVLASYTVTAPTVTRPSFE